MLVQDFKLLLIVVCTCHLTVIMIYFDFLKAVIRNPIVLVRTTIFLAAFSLGIIYDWLHWFAVFVHAAVYCSFTHFVIIVGSFNFNHLFHFLVVDLLEVCTSLSSSDWNSYEFVTACKWNSIFGGIDFAARYNRNTYFL